MKLENQVVSLDLAKRLKELGVKQESLFAWDMAAKEPKLQFANGNLSNTEISAFTVAELGELLKLQLGNMPIHWNDNFGQWYFWPTEELKEKLPYPTLPISANTEADARGKMLCYLLENKIINLESI
jgi:hypothetical protein